MENFQKITLIFILVQFGDLYCNHILFALAALGFILLIDHSAKPLSPGDWTHWSIFSPCNYSLSFCPKLAFSKTCTNKFLVLPKWSCHHHLHLGRHWSGVFGHSKSYLDALSILTNTLSAWTDLAWLLVCIVNLIPWPNHHVPWSPY